MPLDNVLTTLLAALPLLVVMAVASRIERIRPVKRLPAPTLRFNLAYALVQAPLQALIVPAASLATVAALNTAGGGWLVLPASGWKLVPAFLLYAATLDFLEYLFHRLQHRIPALWAMHSLHHSDAAVNAFTTTRHYWVEQCIKTLTIYLVAGLLFKANAVILGGYFLLSLSNVFAHMNLRLGLGRCWMLLNSPQYHRIHHSAQPEHRDRNFAAMFPVFDLLLGTAYKPAADEYPATGLDSGDGPADLMEAVLWPLHDGLRRIRNGNRHRRAETTRAGISAGTRSSQ